MSILKNKIKNYYRWRIPLLKCGYNLSFWFLFVILFGQVSCQMGGRIQGLEKSPENDKISNTSEEINKVPFGPGESSNKRLPVAKELLSQRTKWSEQCQKNKIDLFCWLEDKNKVNPILESARLLIQQGPTSGSEISLVATLPRIGIATIVRLYDRETKHIFEPSKLREATRDFTQEKNLLIYFTKLQPNKKYELLIADVDGTLIDEREVSTLPKKIKPLKFAVVSCVNDFYYHKGGAEMWDDLWSLKPNFILEIGDNSYADIKNGKVVDPITEQHIWERYIETRSILSIYRKHQLVPIIAVWDDHDYGSNDGDRTFVLKEKSLKIFKDFFAQDEIPNFFENGPAVSSSFAVDGQRFVLMDDRYFRSIDKPSPAKIKAKNNYAESKRVDTQNYETHFGKEGELFLMQKLNESKIPTWLISGDQFFGAYHSFESYVGNQPESFKIFLKQLNQAKSKVVFISGDRHLSEVMEIGKPDLNYSTFEITSSAIHSSVHPGAWVLERNPRQLAGASGVYNYSIIESETQHNNLQFKILAYTSGKTLLYERQLKVTK